MRGVLDNEGLLDNMICTTKCKTRFGYMICTSDAPIPNN